MTIKQTSIRIVITILIAVTILAGCDKKPAGKNNIERYREDITYYEPVPGSSTSAKPLTAYKPAAKRSLSDVIRSARTWGPAFQSWYGRTSSDFTLTDIRGNRHTLSEYHGKDVLITFWTTWCPACKRQIQHLTALRDIVGEDRLTMLVISYITKWPPNTTDMVRSFVNTNRIRYPIISVEVSALPNPYNRISSIPCSFFIDSEGKIKVAAVGLVTLADMQAILEAQR